MAVRSKLRTRRTRRTRKPRMQTIVVRIVGTRPLLTNRWNPDLMNGGCLLFEVPGHQTIRPSASLQS